MNIKKIKQIKLQDFLASIGCKAVKQYGVNLMYLSPLRTEKHASFKVNNVSSTNSEQCKLYVHSSLYIDARLLWKQTIGGNGS